MSKLNAWPVAGLILKSLAVVLAAAYVGHDLYGLYSDFAVSPPPIIPAPDPSLAGTAWDLLNAPVTRLNIYLGDIWRTVFFALILWTLGGLLPGMASAQPFARSLRDSLHRIGIFLALAALPKIVTVTTDHGALRLATDLSIEPVTLVLIGAGLFLVTRQGRALTSELEHYV